MLVRISVVLAAVAMAAPMPARTILGFANSELCHDDAICSGEATCTNSGGKTVPDMRCSSNICCVPRMCGAGSDLGIGRCINQNCISGNTVSKSECPSPSSCCLPRISDSGIKLIQEFESGVTSSVLLNEAKALVQCIADVVKFPVSQDQLDALVSVVRSITCDTFKTSAIVTELNKGSIETVPRLICKLAVSTGTTLDPKKSPRKLAEATHFNAKVPVDCAKEVTLP